MSESNFYKPTEVRPMYGEIVTTYQEAFAGDPWYEVSKCADPLSRCEGGLSALAIGMTCDTCANCPLLPAYETDELIARFDNLGNSRPTAWYLEQNIKGITLAAIAWKANARLIADERYADVPPMSGWLETTLGNDDIMWLDEVFANKNLKPEGNLRNFCQFLIGLATRLETDTIAYRTKEVRMLAAAERDFRDAATIYNYQKEVPDRRDFIVIKLEEL